MADVSKRVQKAEKYLLKGKAADALQEYLLAYREDPSNHALVEIIAELYVRQNQQPQAMECYAYLFDKHLEDKDENAAVVVFRKMMRLGYRDVDRLFQFARLLHKTRPDEARTHYKACAEAWEQKGERVKAFDALSALGELDDKNSSLQRQLARMAQDVGRSEDAAQFLLTAALIERQASGREDDPGAIDLLKHAHLLDPNDITVALTLARSLILGCRAAEAVPPLQSLPPGLPERDHLLAVAKLDLGQLKEAEEMLWPLVARLPEAYADLLTLSERFADMGDPDSAIANMKRVKPAITKAGREPQFRQWVEKLLGRTDPSIPYLRLIAALQKELNHESKYVDALSRVFEAAVPASDYVSAAAALGELAQFDTSNEANQARLKCLEGKADAELYKSLAAQILPASMVMGAGAGGDGPALDFGGIGGGAALIAPGSIEDELLDIEMLLQFSGKEAGVARLREVLAAHPGEEQKNAKLYSLMVETGLAPPGGGPSAQAAAPLRIEPGPTLDMRKVSAVTRSLFRQNSAKQVLSTLVNELSQICNVSRCLAGLCVPGKPPSAAMEYCAPGTRGSDAASVLKLITTLVAATGSGKTVEAEDVAACPELAPIAPVLSALSVQALAAVAIHESEKQSGVLIFEQCDRRRAWDPAEMEMVRTVADQAGMAVAQLKLRSLVQAVADEHSGLLARAAYFDCLVRECALARRTRSELSAALIEFGDPPSLARLTRQTIDNFMQEAASVLVNHLRQGDIGIRYDTTALAIVFPGTRTQDAVGVVDRVKRICASAAPELRGIPISCAVVQAILRSEMEPEDSVTELVNRLESALDQARVQPGSITELPAPVVPPSIL